MRIFTLLICFTALFGGYSARALTFLGSPSVQITQNGQTVFVDVQVMDFTDVAGYQFSMNWDPALLQFQGLSNFQGDLNATNFNTSNTAGGELRAAYFVSYPTLSLPDGSTLFTLQFLAVGSPGSTATVSITNSPLPIAAYNSSLQSLSVNTLPAQVLIEPTGGLSISGNIHRSSGAPVPDVQVNLSGDLTANDLTDIAGDYLFSGLPAGSNLTLTPEKNTGPTECVSVRDIIFIAKHILGIAPLGPYQVVAADVNKSLSITSFDVAELRKLILGFYPNFPSNTSWRFIPADFVFPNPANPFGTPFPESANVLDLQTDVVQDFIGIKTGDATDCVNDAPGPAFLTLSAPHQTGTTGQQISLDVTTQGFSNVDGLQFSMSWDPAVIQLDQLNNLHPGLTGSSGANYNSTQSANGQLSFCWNDPNLLGTSLPDGSVLFTLQFTITGPGGSSTPVAFVQTPTKFEVVDNNCLPYGLNHNNGSVTVEGNSSSTDLQLYAGSAISCGGDPVCVDITVANFNQIVGGQFSMAWDPSVFAFQQFQNLNPALGLSAANFNAAPAGSGQIAFSWFDQNLTGITLPDGAVLFSICFTPLGTAGSSTSLTFTSSPTALEFSNLNGEVVPVQTHPGTLGIGAGSGQVVCNDLVSVAADENCQVSVSIGQLIEGNCNGGFTIGILETVSGPLIVSGTGMVSFDASGYIGQTVYFQVTDPATGNYCWGQLEITGACSPCTAVSAALSVNPNQSGCCHTLEINNQQAGLFAYLNLNVLNGGSLAAPVTAGVNWSVQGFSGTNAYLVPDGGAIPTGNSVAAQFCLHNLTATPQFLEIQYFNTDNEILCRDTLTVNCTACVQASVDTLYCNSWNNYGANICIKAGEELGYLANSATLIPPAGVLFTASAPHLSNTDGSLILSLPNLAPGATACFPIAVSGAVSAGQAICFTAIIHDQDLTLGEPDLNCCTDSVPVCFELPACDPCDPETTYATAEPSQVPGEKCCWNITLHNPPGYYTGVGTQILTPGVDFSVIGNYPGSGWLVNTASPYSLSNVWWTPVPPQPGGTVIDGNTMPTVCLADDGSGTASIPQDLLIIWEAADGSRCFDTLQFECLITDLPGNCLSVDSVRVLCPPGGGGPRILQMNVTNQTTTLYADEITLTQISGGGTISPSNISGYFPPGSTTPVTANLSATSGQVCFLVTLHEINDNEQHLNCCTLEDTICVAIPTCLPNANSSLNMLVYPNPASNQVFLSFDEPLPGDAQLRVLDMTGSVRLREKTLPAGAQMDVLYVNLLPEGMYLVDLRIPGVLARRELFIVHHSGPAVKE